MTSEIKKNIRAKMYVTPTYTKIKAIFLILALFFIFSLENSYSQQSQPYTQYLFNRFLLNPAACGSEGFTSVGLVTKNQWIGFKDAPVNQVLTAQVRLTREGLFGNKRRRGSSAFSPENVGLGAALFNDMRGPIRTTGGQLTYAYHLKFPTAQLSFGLTTSIFQLYIDRDKIVTELGHDRYLDANKLSSFIPEAATGVQYAAGDYYVGFSTSNLFQSYLTFGGRSSSDYKLEREYIFLGGYIFEIDHEWSIVPGSQFKFTEHGALQLDINILTYYYDKIWFGSSYRSGGGGSFGGTSLMFGIRLNEYYFGYAFDYTLSKIQKYSYGSHELMVSATFGQKESFFRYNRKYEFHEQRHSRKMVKRRR